MLKKILPLVTVVSVLVAGFYILSPFDNLPSSIKQQKTVYQINSLVDEFRSSNNTEFKAEQADELYQNTYRLLHVDSWVESGLPEADIRTALQNMKDSTNERSNPNEYDTVIAYGPGNWVYEFEALGDQYASTAAELEQQEQFKQAGEQYMIASLFYKTAAFPGIFEEWGPNYQEVRDAYDKSVAHYVNAGAYFDVHFETVQVTVDGKEITGLLHLPKNSDPGPVPAILSTNGSDFFMVELFAESQPLLERGIAVLMFDIPGIGASRELPLEPNSNLHQAFLDALLQDDRIDTSRIGVTGVSMGGNLSIRLAYDRPDDVVMAVNICGPIEQVTHIPVDVAEEEFPQMTIDALWSRFGQNTLDKANFEPIFSQFGLISDGTIREGDQLSIPLLSVNTDSDPVNPLWEMNLLAQISNGGQSIVSEGEGHCPEQDYTVEVINWIESALN